MFLTSTLSNWRLSFSSSYFLEKVENNNILSYVYLHPSCNKHNITIALHSILLIKLVGIQFSQQQQKAVQRQSFLFLFLFLFCYLMSKRFSNFKKAYVWCGVGLCTHALMKFCISLDFMRRFIFSGIFRLKLMKLSRFTRKKICKRPKVFWHICKCQFTRDCNKFVFIHET